MTGPRVLPIRDFGRPFRYWVEIQGLQFSRDELEEKEINSHIASILLIVAMNCQAHVPADRPPIAIVKLIVPSDLGALKQPAREY